MDLKDSERGQSSAPLGEPLARDHSHRDNKYADRDSWGVAPQLGEDSRRGVERAHKLGSRRESIGRNFGQDSLNRLGDSLRNPVADHPQWRGTLGDQFGYDRLRAPTEHRGFSCQHLVGDCAERVEIAAGVDQPVAGGLLGAHVLRRPDHEPGLREPLTPGLAHRERDTEVGEHRNAVVQQDIFRLDVAVNHTLGMRVVERRGDLTHDARYVLDRKATFLIHPLPKRATAHVGEGVIQQVSGAPGVEQRHHIRVIQLGGQADLGQETFPPQHSGELGPQDLECHLALVLQVCRQVDRGHSSASEFPLDQVPIPRRASVSVGDAGLMLSGGRSFDRRGWPTGGAGGWAYVLIGTLCPSWLREAAVSLGDLGLGLGVAQ